MTSARANGDPRGHRRWRIPPEPPEWFDQSRGQWLLNWLLLVAGLDVWIGLDWRVYYSLGDEISIGWWMSHLGAGALIASHREFGPFIRAIAVPGGIAAAGLMASFWEFIADDTASVEVTVFLFASMAAMLLGLWIIGILNRNPADRPAALAVSLRAMFMVVLSAAILIAGVTQVARRKGWSTDSLPDPSVLIDMAVVGSCHIFAVLVVHQFWSGRRSVLAAFLFGALGVVAFLVGSRLMLNDELLVSCLVEAACLAPLAAILSWRSSPESKIS